MSDAAKNTSPLVRHFRQILLWPLQVMHARVREPHISKYWELLEAVGEQSPWREVEDEFGDPDDFQERHYKEFITFLPYVQRFLYGEGTGREALTGYGKSPIRVYRRRDVAKMRVVLDEQAPPVVFEVAHVDLYFFYDIDIIILAVEFFTEDLPLALAQETLFKLGRAYPAFWEASGQGGQCPRRVEWLTATGEILAVSDYENRRKYLNFVCRHRSPNVAAHWDYLLRPLALYHSDREGMIRYRQIEYHRMPLLAYLSFDDPRSLSRGDFARLALITRSGPSDTLPYSAQELADFERRYCYDKFWNPADPALGSRYLCCGHAFVMVGQAGDRFFANRDTGLLGQFRHQYFLVNLIAHFHKAALMLFSEWLVMAISRLDIHDVESVKTFKREIRRIFETFLRFTHRYWFHEVSNQAQAKDLFRMLTGHLDTDRIYQDVSEAVKEMNQYLDSDGLRRQANTVVRLTVVTTLGLIATVLTGFLGMNIFDYAGESFWIKLLIVMGVLTPTILLVFYGVAKSKVLSDFLEALSDERLALRDKLGVLFKVWEKRPPNLR
ncbi:MAG: CorA family divalent cation transporter [Candidatus Contendobacter sp.]|nr:CorA family divalent cation transporter [Candidatus Contendobacter sp.]